ncbi:hypothetical protein [Streptomyces sp. NRRL S-455]|uniref:hypothetical protein n=1 Tax=Streptomyces sp. NRRL S-455 TaxID=1463908 RepID=UPI0004C1C8EF|nr:hypothetical protein [Streptomyces sp. NRRL S-455]
MTHHHQTTEDVDPDCPRCQEETTQYWTDVEAWKLRTAVEMATDGTGHASPSALMLRLGQDHGIRVTFEEAQALLNRLETAGVVGPADGWTHAHPVLMRREQALVALSLPVV